MACSREGAGVAGDAFPGGREPGVCSSIIPTCRVGRRCLVLLRVRVVRLRRDASYGADNKELRLTLLKIA
jgi:hypothetical protein